MQSSPLLVLLLSAGVSGFAVPATRAPHALHARPVPALARVPSQSAPTMALALAPQQ